MNKNHRLFIIFLAATIAYFFLYEDKFFHSGKSDLITIVSTGKKWRPGTGEDLLVYVFEKTDEGMVFVRDLNLHAAISHSDLQSTTPIHVRFKHLSEGSYCGAAEIPEEWKAGKAKVKIWSGDSGKVLLKDFETEIGKSHTLVVLPPKDSIAAGSWVNFNFAVIDSKSCQGTFKSPVRVKLETPSGNATVNRIIPTDLNGNGIFTTHFNSHAPEGVYKFSFTHANETRQFDIWVGSSQQRNLQLTEQLKSTIGDFFPLSSILNAASTNKIPSSAKFHLDTQLPKPENSLRDISIEKHNAILNYSSPDSEYRQIEIWQGGSAVYTSDLPLPAGRISIPLNLPLRADFPAVFKLWYIQNGLIDSAEQTLPPENPLNKTLQDTLQGLPHLFSMKIEPADFFMALAGQSLRTEAYGISLATCSIETNAKKIVMHRSPQNHVTSDESISPKCFDQTNSDLKQHVNKRIFLIDTEMDSSRYRFNKVRIWHDPEKFLTSMLFPIISGGFNIFHVAAEAEIRALRFPYLPLNEQSAELEKLEGLLIPLGEFFMKNPDKQNHSVNSKLIGRAILRLGTLIRLPDKLKTIVNKQKINLNRIGPIPPLINDEMPIKKLMLALQAGGKATFFTPERNINLNLTGANTAYRLKSSPGLEKHITKLVNGRMTPLVVELDFSDE